MQNLWNDKMAQKWSKDPLELRTYTSNLIGQSQNLVLHGGGNTSVKVTENDFFGKEREYLYVKGSGWDLASIQPQGFSAVCMDVLKRLAAMESLTDIDMVREQKAAMKNPSSPSPSVEAILHAIIPFKYVDHTHADAVVTLTNCIADVEKLKSIFGTRMLFVPYVMPGFILARKVFEITRDVNWADYDGMILMNHGVFSFADDAKKSYDSMIEIVNVAEKELQSRGYEVQEVAAAEFKACELALEEQITIATLRKKLSLMRGRPVLCQFLNGGKVSEFSEMKNVENIATSGPLTPDHSIHTKPWPMIFKGHVEQDCERFARDYKNYFDRNKRPSVQMLDACPRWVVWPKKGVFAVADNAKKMGIVADIASHTVEVMCNSSSLGGWKGLSRPDLFDVEYWELEQAKLNKKSQSPEHEGKVVIITGAASGIGRAIANQLLDSGACVSAWDIDSKVIEIFSAKNSMGLSVDVRDASAMQEALSQTVQKFGGVDMLILNAGIFPSAKEIDQLEQSVWDDCVNINLTCNQKLLKSCIPFLKLGIQPSVLFVGSKNVNAPGPGAAAYSVAKAGLTQLARVAAMELGKFGIPVNVIHPNAVFDTGIWTDEVLKNRAKHYAMSVDEYKKNNILKTEILSSDVAKLAEMMVSSVFSKTTGAQVPIDGGNDRII